MDRLKDKVAIVTGSTSGIGIAKLFAAEGAKVVICGRRQEKGQAVVDEIVKAGGEASYHFMDITVVESIEQLIADTADKYGKIDILVNNAANVGLKDGRWKLGIKFSKAISAVLSMLPNAYCPICRRMRTVARLSISVRWPPVAVI